MVGLFFEMRKVESNEIAIFLKIKLIQKIRQTKYMNI